MTAKLPVPVFDSSSIDIPNPPQIKFSSFEGQPLVAWRPSNRSRSRDAPGDLTAQSLDRAPSRKYNGLSSPRTEQSSDGPIDGRASPLSRQALHSNNRKWAEPTNDKRSKTILDILKSKREDKKQQRNSAKTESAEYASTVGEDIKNDKYLTYPKFVVREGKKIKKSESGMDNKSPERALQHRSVNSDQVRDYSHNTNNATKGDNVRQEPQSNMQPITEFRRKSPQKPMRAYLYESPKGKSRQINSQPETPRDYGHMNDREVDDFIMGFYPENMQEFLQAKAIHAASGRPATNSQKLRSQSPPQEHIPPPPTPASQLLMQLGFDHSTDYEKVEEEMKKEEYLQLERRRSLRERTRNRDKNLSAPKQNDPGVSHTTHQLLEQNIIKRQFVFPNLGPEALRKSFNNTPRVDDRLYMYRMTPSSPQRTKTPYTSQSNYAHVQFATAEPVTVYDLSDAEEYALMHPSPALNPAHSNSALLQHPSPGLLPEQAASKTDLSVCPEQMSACEPQRSFSSLGMAAGNMVRSHSFYQGQKRDKYARMISLPKVTIDIDKNSFNKNSYLRRSMELRQKYQPEPEGSKEMVAVGEQSGEKYLKKNSVTQTNQQAHDSGDVAKKNEKNSVSTKNIEAVGGSKDRVHTVNLDILASSEMVPPYAKTPDLANHPKLRPPPNTPIDGESSVFQRRSVAIRRGSATKIPLKDTRPKQVAKAKTSLGVTSLQMVSPATEGNNGNESDLKVNGRKAEYDKPKHQFKSPVEIIL